MLIKSRKINRFKHYVQSHFDSDLGAIQRGSFDNTANMRFFVSRYFYSVFGDICEQTIQVTLIVRHKKDELHKEISTQANVSRMRYFRILLITD